MEQEFTENREEKRVEETDHAHCRSRIISNETLILKV